jgi:alkylhydroperoxidase family enzyme
VERGPDEDDRRALRAELTTEGRAAAVSVRRHEIEFARDILDRLPDGSAPATLDALDRLLAALRAATESCCPGAYDHLFADSGVERASCCASGRGRETEGKEP